MSRFRMEVMSDVPREAENVTPRQPSLEDYATLFEDVSFRTC
jgi:hypothetical protein